MQHTPLTDTHQAAGAKLVDFAGFAMPVHYGSQIEEHHAVRKDAGIFDVSHMLMSDIIGNDAKVFLQYVMANDVAKLVPGKALYTCMLNEHGGVIDDLIIYMLSDTHYRIVSNAGTRQKDMDWLQQHATNFSVTVTPNYDRAILAVQGPNAMKKLAGVLPKTAYDKIAALTAFHFINDNGMMIARTGYTGEDGVELVIPATQAHEFWLTCMNAGISPCGLGARDTLRLEAGLNLYGNDMDDTVTPLEAGLSWTVAMKDNRDFIGRKALEQQKDQGVPRQLRGITLKDRGVLRAHYIVHTDKGTGEITSGTFSPTLTQSIGFALVPYGTKTCEVEIRGKKLAAELCSVRFLR